MRSPRKLTCAVLGLGLLTVSVWADAPSKSAPSKPTSTPAKPAPVATASKPVPAPAAKPSVPVAVKPTPPAANPAAHAPAPAPVAPPDYGGRDSAPLAVGDNAPNPLAQAGRALEALLLVLAGIVGVVYALKRYGLVTPGGDGKPARIAFPTGLGRFAPAPSAGASPITVVSSQALPGGAMLHVVSVKGRTLLLAATAHAVTSVAEWPDEPEPADERGAFEDYLARADAASPLGAANARLRSLLSRPPPGDLP